MKIAIHWFRQDLRLHDNPSLLAAIDDAEAVLPIYILDDENAGEHKMGGAARVWLHHSLDALNQSLDQNLSIYKGSAEDILTKLVERFDATSVHWNRCYEPWRMARDKKIKSLLCDMGVEVESHNGSLLWEPWTINKDDGNPYKIFTPFYRNGCLKAPEPREPLDKHESFKSVKDEEGAITVPDLNLIPNIRWDRDMLKEWDISEAGALNRLDAFIGEGLDDYKEGRNFPVKKCVSRLSPYLHFGQISPNTIWHGINQQGANDNIDHFCSELGWREFAHNLLYNNHDLPHENLQSKFDDFPWHEDDEALRAWQMGQTGIPIIDAGMRELWQTGYIHNRVRMLVASFLVKNLLLDWREGETWFWDCLFDADLANNSAAWQWVAGCGTDAAPYFRIFNPVTQGQKFDAKGAYVRRFVPEIKDMPDKYIHAPWEAPKDVLEEAGVELGTTYPKPIADLKKSRARALEAFQSL